MGYEIPINDHIAPMVEAVKRGEQVVVTRNGKEVVRLAAVERPAETAKPRVIDDDFLARMRAHQEHIRTLGIPPGDAAKLIREMRDEGY